MKKRMTGVMGLALLVSMGLATMAHADDYKSFGVRMRAIYVKPSESIDGGLDGHVKLGDSIIPEVDFEYFFTKKISTELIAGVTKHDVKLDGATVGSTWLLPPTLTVKYHPLAGSKISPYVGVGVNVTIPFESELSGVAGTPKFSIDNSVGWAGQVGADIKIAENMYFNIDYKYINADTKVTIGSTKYNLDINPNLFGIGVGYRF